jgi:hypothetical protein
MAAYTEPHPDYPGCTRFDRRAQPDRPMIRLHGETRDVWMEGGAGLFATILYAVALARGDRERIREIAGMFAGGPTIDMDTATAMLTGEIEHRIEGDGSVVFMVPV